MLCGAGWFIGRQGGLYQSQPSVAPQHLDLSAKMPDFSPAPLHLRPAPVPASTTGVPLTRFVGQDQEQAVRLQLRLDKEQGAHPGPSLGRPLPTQDLGEFLLVVLPEVLLGRRRKTTIGTWVPSMPRTAPRVLTIILIEFARFPPPPLQKDPSFLKFQLEETNTVHY